MFRAGMIVAGTEDFGVGCLIRCRVAGKADRGAGRAWNRTFTPCEASPFVAGKAGRGYAWRVTPWRASAMSAPEGFWNIRMPNTGALAITYSTTER